jgi:hypothetical protein
MLSTECSLHDNVDTFFWEVLCVLLTLVDEWDMSPYALLHFLSAKAYLACSSPLFFLPFFIISVIGVF